MSLAPETSRIETPLDVARAIFGGQAAVARLPKVYPGYLAKLVRDALRHHGDPEGVITTIDDIVRIGDGKDLIVATDFNATRYRITVEAEPAKTVSHDPNPDELEDGLAIPRETAIANARLIATAPELLAELVEVDRFWTEDFPDGPDKPSILHPSCRDLWRRIRAAIAKATTP